MFSCKNLKAIADQSVDISFHKLGDIFAQGGTLEVQSGNQFEFRSFDDFKANSLVNQRLSGKRTVSQPLSNLFALENLTDDIVASLVDVKFCIGRGSLIKLLHALRQDHSYYHKSFTFTFTKNLLGDHHYIVIEDTEKWNTKPSYGHTISDSVTNLNNFNRDGWYHYIYNQMNIGTDFSILLRNEVDAIVDKTGLGIEIKSYNNCYLRDMEHYALCVLLGTTCGLSVIERKGAQVISHKIFSRQDLRNYCAQDILHLLAAVKTLLLQIYQLMSPDNVSTGELIYDFGGSLTFQFREIDPPA
jgi:hypothetical protein